MKDHFIPGLKASELFYHEVVHPILDEHFPGLKHAAGKVPAFDLLKRGGRVYAVTIINASPNP